MIKDRYGDVWLTPKEAADKLNISVSWIYHIKNRLTHRKGNGKQARIFFLDRTLVDDYFDVCE